MAELLTSETLRLGFAGVVIVALAAVVVWLARRNERLHEARRTETEKLQELRHVDLEKRHAETVELLGQLSEVVDRNTEAFIKHAEGFQSLRNECSLRRRG